MHIVVESRMRCILLLCYTIYTFKGDYGNFAVAVVWRIRRLPHSEDTSYPKLRICRKSLLGFFYDFCPLKLRQRLFECSPEHRLCPMDFVSALMGVRRKRAAAGQLFVSNTV
jgi:hypothetical protein